MDEKKKAGYQPDGSFILDDRQPVYRPDGSVYLPAEDKVIPPPKKREPKKR